MSGEPARRGKQWWQLDELATDSEMASNNPTMPDPWIDFTVDAHLALSAAQRAFLIGDFDQPSAPRLRTIDVEFEVAPLDTESTDAESFELNGAPAGDSRRPRRSDLRRPRAATGRSTGNATGKRPGDTDSDDPYGREP